MSEGQKVRAREEEGKEGGRDKKGGGEQSLTIKAE